MHLQLVRPQVPLQDGNPSWDASATDALTLWMPFLDRVRFVASGDPTSLAGGDGVNAVFFSNTIYGEDFGPNTLAVTTRFSNGSIFAETDVIFNNLKQWNSYRGPIQGGGPNPVFDLHRVALHEFGHVLGLDHPDVRGQTVTAIMNSNINDLDSLTEDDADGARALYGFRISSSLTPPAVLSGDPFTYQITAALNPTTFGASGLPAGLTINSSTGVITGQCPTSGTFFVDVTATGPQGTARGRVRIVINPRPITSALAPEIYIGQSFTYQISAGNNPTSFAAINLPEGFTLDPNTGVISGTPTEARSYSFTVIARSATSEAAATVYLTVARPRITSAAQAPPVAVGAPLSYQITVSHPASSLTVTNLPPGTQLDPATGLISGVTTTAGFFTAYVQAQTAYGVASAYIQFVIKAPVITSSLTPADTLIGAPFTYQITANHQPTSFSAVGLPDALRLNPDTGLITGVVTLTGRYTFRVIAHGTLGDASNSIVLLVLPRPAPSNIPVASIPTLAQSTLLADPVRPRIYAINFAGLLVLDSTTFAVLREFPSSFGYRSMDISPDGSVLYLAQSMMPGGSTTPVRRLDLETFEFRANLETGRLLSQLVAGSDNRLYAADAFQPNLIFQIEQDSGNTLTFFDGKQIARSRDHRTLFVLEGSRVLQKYDLVPAAAPVLLQSIEAAGSQSFCRSLTVSPADDTVAVVTQTPGTTLPDPVLLRSASDLTAVQSTLPVTAAITEVAFSANGALAILWSDYTRRIEVIELSSLRLRQRIVQPSDTPLIGYGSPKLALNADASHIFISTYRGSSNAVDVYPIQRPPEPPPHSLLNVSTRLRAQAGDDFLIGGFIVTGTEPKKILARAIGPSLSIPGALSDPVIEIYDANRNLVAQNNNWNERRDEIFATGAVPASDRESAVVTTLPPGAYTAVLSGRDGGTGIALVELFDLAPGTSRIANISTRGKVETGDNVMIGGFIIGGDEPTRVILRAIGPSLGGQGVAGALADTTLSLHDSNGAQIAANDDWQSDQAEEIIATTVPPTDPHESALVRTLPPGSYTAIVRGKNDTTGVALVEVYNLQTN